VVPSEFGVGTIEGWISGGLGLLDTIRRREVSAIRDIKFVIASFSIAMRSQSSKVRRRMRWGIRTRFGEPFSTVQDVSIPSTA
jgi:hypothetical protein